MSTATLEAQERKSKIEEVFDASFLELLQIVPTNPLVRAWILKFTGKMPPEDCVTFAQLKDWVEFNCTKKVRPKPRSITSDDGIGILVHFTETEYGRCNYQVDRSGEDTFRIGGEEIINITQEAIDGGGGLTEVVDEIASRIDDDAWSECDPSMESYGDYDYEEHDSTDSGNGEVTYNREQIRTRVLAYLQNHQPELANQL